MDAALLVARIVLAAVFVVAGLAKVADRRGARTAARDFGAPEWLAGPLAVVLPLAELAVAVLLVPAATAVWGALGALALLAVFTVAIGAAMARGKAPDCHCFGQLHSEPAGWSTLVRNGVLAGLAASVLAGGGGPSAVAWIGDLEGAEIVALAVGAAAVALLVVAGFALLHVMRSYGRVLVRLERVEQALAEAGFDLHQHEEMPEIGLAPGTPAPAFSLPNVLGDTVTLESLLAPGRPLFLLFTSPTCGPCTVMLPSVSTWQRELAETLTIALVNSGGLDAIRAEAEEHALARVLVDEKLEVYGAYEANGTPSAVVVSPDGEIASWVAAGADWVEHLVHHTTGAHEEEEDEVEPHFEDGIPVGDPAPELTLADLDGRPVELGDFRGAETALLFWSPGCGFCRAMHEDLLEWERGRNGASPRLVVVSSGDPEETRRDGFASPVLLDGDFAAGNAFSANGTPMAVLVDAEGRVASRVAAGSPAVLALLRSGADAGAG